MESARLLWIDLRVSETDSSCQQLFETRFSVKGERRNLRQLSAPQQADGERREAKQKTGIRCSSTSGIELICFEFDYPDLQSLNLLKRTRQRYPQIPILMITLQHSEALAIWALRLHVWDFLVKPITESSVTDVEESIRKFKTSQSIGNSVFDLPNVDCMVPQELRFQPERSGADSLKRGLQLIHDRLGEKIIEKDIADACGLGLFTFSKAFKRLMGQTFQDYVLQQRIIEAMRLLMHPNATITDVAYLVGFRDISYFSKIFKRSVGCSPSIYRSEGCHSRPLEGGPEKLKFCDRCPRKNMCRHFNTSNQSKLQELR